MTQQRRFVYLDLPWFVPTEVYYRIKQTFFLCYIGQLDNAFVEAVPITPNKIHPRFDSSWRVPIPVSSMKNCYVVSSKLQSSDCLAAQHAITSQDKNSLSCLCYVQKGKAKTQCGQEGQRRHDCFELTLRATLKPARICFMSRNFLCVIFWHIGLKLHRTPKRDAFSDAGYDITISVKGKQLTTLEKYLFL